MYSKNTIVRDSTPESVQWEFLRTAQTFFVPKSVFPRLQKKYFKNPELLPDF
jgi:hypothetical protein